MTQSGLFFPMNDRSSCLQRLGSGLLLCLLDKLLELALLLDGHVGRLAVKSLDARDIDSAYGSLDFLAHRYAVKYRCITHKGEYLWTHLGLHDGKLAQSHGLRCLVNDRLRQSRILKTHLLLVYDKHRHCLLHGIYLLTLLILPLLCLLAKEVQDYGDDHKYCQYDESYYQSFTHD